MLQKDSTTVFQISIDYHRQELWNGEIDIKVELERLMASIELDVG